MNGETRDAVNSISKGEKVVILYQFCVTVGRMLCSWIWFSFIFQTSPSSGAMGNYKANALTTGIEDDSNVLQNLKLELRITMPTDGNKAN